jgi:hypothetical protein
LKNDRQRVNGIETFWFDVMSHVDYRRDEFSVFFLMEALSSAAEVCATHIRRARDVPQMHCRSPIANCQFSRQ